MPMPCWCVGRGNHESLREHQQAEEVWKIQAEIQVNHRSRNLGQDEKQAWRIFRKEDDLRTKEKINMSESTPNQEQPEIKVDPENPVESILSQIDINKVTKEDVFNDIMQHSKAFGFRLIIGAALLEKLALLDKPQQEEDSDQNETDVAPTAEDTNQPNLEVVETPEDTQSKTD
jgi:hypothetical protein